MSPYTTQHDHACFCTTFIHAKDDAWTLDFKHKYDHESFTSIYVVFYVTYQHENKTVFKHVNVHSDIQFVRAVCIILTGRKWKCPSQVPFKTGLYYHPR
jgi:hypothetical protein